VRPNAILVPQRAVQQGAKGHFVWVVTSESKAQMRPVVVGDWYDDHWFVNEGLTPGDRLVVDGVLRLSQGATVAIVPSAAPAGNPAPASAPPATAAPRG
jgi:membrane fusion protein (multidrug efflux system)